LREAFLHRTDELRGRALLNELRSLARFFECNKTSIPMISQEQEMATQEALNCVVNQNIPRAISVLCQAVDSEPLNLKGRLLLATIYMNLRSYTRAIKALNKGREACRQAIKYWLIHADLLEQDKNMPKDRDFVFLLHRIADIRFYEGLFLHRLAEGLIHVGAYDQALLLLASWNANDQPTHGF
jgi:tetratricopeptide (TPR) repeat protein